MSILNFKNVKISRLTDFIGLRSCVFGVSSNQICAALEKQFLILTASHAFHYFFELIKSVPIKTAIFQPTHPLFKIYFHDKCDYILSKLVNKAHFCCTALDSTISVMLIMSVLWCQSEAWPIQSHQHVKQFVTYCFYPGVQLASNSSRVRHQQEGIAGMAIAVKTGLLCQKRPIWS